MEFHEKLQELRKQKGLTQEELAAFLYVSRTAVSKWESGRGYPNIDSLRAISSFFSVSLDDLLSTDEALTIAENDQKKKESHFCDILFGLLDLSVLLFLFLPLFTQTVEGEILAVSLPDLPNISLCLNVAYLGIFFGMLGVGVLTLALQNLQGGFWRKHQRRLSLAVHVLGVLLLILGRQPYAAALLFVFLILKVCMLLKKK